MIETNATSFSLDTECRTQNFWSFGFWSLDIVSNFEFRYSDLISTITHILWAGILYVEASVIVQ